jgi:hypothetical protein
VDDLDRELSRLGALGSLDLGRGPRHPSAPRPELAASIAAFLERYPFLRRDPAYVEFLERYAGAVLFRSQDMFSVGIYGFDEDVAMHIVSGPGDIIEDGCLTIADVVTPNEPDQPFSENVDSHGIAFDATGSRPWGLYRTREGHGERIGDGFIEWLRQLADEA